VVGNAHRAADSLQPRLYRNYRQSSQKDFWRISKNKMREKFCGAIFFVVVCGGHEKHFCFSASHHCRAVFCAKLDGKLGGEGSPAGWNVPHDLSEFKARRRANYGNDSRDAVLLQNCRKHGQCGWIYADRKYDGRNERAAREVRRKARG